MSSVRNLLAMFENKGDAKPPERGRSPGAPLAPSSASGTDSPRPLSKIRTSFVAIEKDGRVGLTRDQSGGSSVSRRRMSNDTEVGSTLPPTEQLLAAEEITAAHKPSSPEPTPGLSRESVPVLLRDVSSTSSSPKKKDVSPDPGSVETRVQVPTPKQGSQSRALSVEPVVIEPCEQPHRKAAQDPVEKSAEPPKAEEKPKGGAEPKGEEKPKAKVVGEPVAKANGKPAPKPELKKKEKPADKKTPAAAPAATPALAPVSTAKTNTKAKKSPVVAKTPMERVPAKSPVPSHDRRPAAIGLKTAGTAHRDRDHERGRGGAAGNHAETDAHVTTSRTGKVAHQPARPTVAGGPPPARKAAPAPVTTSPPATGFIKPKPKSPTKPVRLPSSLMAPTASSAHKTGAGARQTHSRTGNHVPLAAAASNTRSPSRALVGPPSAHANATRPLRRQSSSITRQRPSIGPPPKQMAKDHPPTRKEKEVDESFLARMMRPTQASASKVHDKVQLPVTPPRRPQSTKRLSDQGVVPIKKLTPTKKSPTSINSSPPAEQPSKMPAAMLAVELPSPKMTLSVVDKDEQPISSRANEAGDDTLVEKAKSPEKKEESPVKEEASLVKEEESPSKEEESPSKEEESEANEEERKAQKGVPPSEPVVDNPAIPRLVETLPTPVEAPKEDAAVVEPEPEPESESLVQDLVEASGQEKTLMLFSLEEAAAATDTPKEDTNEPSLQPEKILAENHDNPEADDEAKAMTDITAPEPAKP